MVDIKQLQAMNEAFSQVMKSIFLTPDSSNERNNELTWAQQKILALLDDQGPMKMSDVARQISVTMSNATAIVDKMVRLDLVQREADPNDRRVIRVVASEQGKAVIANCMETQTRCFEQVLKRLSPEKRAKLLASFNTIHELLSELQNQPGEPGTTDSETMATTKV